MYSGCVSVKATWPNRLKDMRPSEAEVARRLVHHWGLGAKMCQVAVLDALFGRVCRRDK